MQTFWKLTAICMTHILLGLGSILMSPAPITFVINSIGLLGSLFYFLRWRRELLFLLQHAPFSWLFVLLQGSFLVLSLFSSPPTLILCWIGLFICEVLRLAQLRTYVHQQKTTERLKQQHYDLDEAFCSIRAERHDFLKHANVVQHLLEEQHYEEAKQYFGELLGQYRTSNRAIKGEQGHITALLLEYQQKAEAQQIELQYDLQAPLSALPMTTIDQIKVMSNLLANSTEAASEYAISAGKASISVRTSMYGGIFIVELTNSTLPLTKETADTLFQRFSKSTKGQGHEGLGTYIIAKTVQQYDGTLRYNYEGASITIKIKVPVVLRK